MKETTNLMVPVIIFAFISTVSCLKNDVSVIVIGAGPAGIAAAARLIENNFENVKILEAEPRIGGRINSVRFGDAFVDLGAQWCHGEEDNVVYDLVKDLDVLRHSVFPRNIFHSSGKALDDEFAEEIFEIMDAIYAADGNRLAKDFLTVGDYCAKAYKNIIHEKYSSNKEKLELALSAMDYFQYKVLASEGSFSWFEPAAKNDYRDCGGDLQLNWSGLGYKTVLDVLMKKLPNQQSPAPIDDKIFLNKEVKKILWNENSNRKAVTVACSDGTKYTADHVIFTPSIGVLKERVSTMFQPKLSDAKYRAIRDIGFGAVMKVALLFPERWWGSETGFNFVWSDRDRWTVLRDLPNDPSWCGKIPNKVGRSWVTYFFAVETTENNPNVLIAWLTGNFVPVIEQLSEEVLVNGIDYVLNKFLSHKYEISKPERIIKTQWYSNPHFRGVYSFQTVRCTRGNSTTSENVLSTPLTNLANRPIVQFAGEATHAYYFSTVHGAIETGYREADVLIDLYSKLS